jgi:hypothetical protein
MDWASIIIGVAGGSVAGGGFVGAGLKAYTMYLKWKEKELKLRGKSSGDSVDPNDANFIRSKYQDLINDMDARITKQDKRISKLEELLEQEQKRTAELMAEHTIKTAGLVAENLLLKGRLSNAAQ